MKHNPLIVVLFTLGILGEMSAATYAGTNFVANGIVVLGTAIYFYVMDDIAKIIKKAFSK